MLKCLCFWYQTVTSFYLLFSFSGLVTTPLKLVAVLCMTQTSYTWSRVVNALFVLETCVYLQVVSGVGWIFYVPASFYQLELPIIER